jgi:hypothetical protein
MTSDTNSDDQKKVDAEKKEVGPGMREEKESLTSFSLRNKQRKQEAVVVQLVAQVFFRSPFSLFSLTAGTLLRESGNQIGRKMFSFSRLFFFGGQCSEAAGLHEVVRHTHSPASLCV